MSAGTVHRVAVLLLDPVIGYDATIPPQFFGEALDAGGGALYETRMVSMDGRPVPTTSGYSLVPGADLDWLRTADTVVVPGTRHRVRDDPADGPEVRDLLRGLRPGVRIMSICTGAFALAAAGIFDGRRATTHWSYASQFRALFPQVDLDEDVLFVDEGDVLSSAGLSAGADLCLHVIRRDHGAVVANAVARHCVVPPWRDGGQAQFISSPVPDVGEYGTGPARAWALANLDRPLSVRELAATVRMSERTFNRRFLQETGQPPGTWLAEQRLTRAMTLLETTTLPVDQVAARSGLGTGANLRSRLRERIGVSPMAYRRTFGAHGGTRSGIGGAGDAGDAVRQ